MGCGASKAPAVSEPVALSSSSSTANKQEATCTAKLPSTIHATAQSSIGNHQEQQHNHNHNHTANKTPEESTAPQAPGHDPLFNKSHSSAPISVMETAEEMNGAKGSENGSPHNPKTQAPFIVHDEAPEFLSRHLVTADNGTSVSEQPDPNEKLLLNSDVEQEQINGIDNYLETHENSNNVYPCLEQHPTFTRQASPLPLSTGGNFGITANIVLDKPLSQADVAALEAIVQNNGDNLSADKAEPADMPNEESDISSADADDDDSREKEQDAVNCQTVYETEKVLKINLQDSITKLSDLTEADYFDDSTKLSYLTDLEKCSPFDSPLHYLSGDFTKYTEDVVSSTRSEYKISSPSSAGSSELDTGTYMQDLLRKINLAKESIDGITEETISSSMLQDLELSSLFSEKHDMAISNYDLHDDSKFCGQTEEQGSDKEKDSSQII